MSVYDKFPRPFYRCGVKSWEISSGFSDGSEAARPVHQEMPSTRRRASHSRSNSRLRCILSLGCIFIAAHSIAGQTAVTLDLSQTSAVYGSPVTLNATVVNAPNIVGGLVVFQNKGVTIGQSSVVATTAQNILPYSASGQAWNVVGGSSTNSVVAAGDAAPDGSSNAWALAADGTTDIYMTQDASVLDNTRPYTFSVWLKLPTGAVPINTFLAIHSNAYVIAATAVAVTSTWQRFSVVAKLPLNSTFVRGAIAGGGSMGPDLAPSTLEAWGAQIEQTPIGSQVDTDGSSLVGSMTNLLAYSASGGAWNTVGSGTTTAATDTAPDGSQKAFVLNYDGSEDTYITQSAGSADTTRPTTFSLWMRCPTCATDTPQKTYLAVHSDLNIPEFYAAVFVTSAWARYSISGIVSRGATQIRAAIGGGGLMGPNVAPGSLEIWGTQVEQAMNGPYVATNGEPVLATSNNILPFSGFGDAWRPINASIEPAAVPAPDGSLTALSLVYDGTSDAYVRQFGALPDASKSYVLSVDVRTTAANPVTTLLGLLTDYGGEYYVEPITVTSQWQTFYDTGYFANNTRTAGISLGSGSTLGPGAPAASLQIANAHLQESLVGPYAATSGSPASQSGGVASLTTSSLPIGANSIVAVYLGPQGRLNVGISPPTNIMVTAESQNRDSFPLTCSPSTITAGQTASCTATLPPGTTGSVSFLVDSNFWTTVTPGPDGIAVAPNGLATAAASGQAHIVTALFTGDADYDQATETTSVLVSPSNGPPTGTLTVDSGSVILTVNGVAETVPYGNTGIVGSPVIASALTAAINGDPASFVTATSIGAIISLTSKMGGAASNYPFSFSSVYDRQDFTQPSFSATPAAGKLTGGLDPATGTPAIIYSYSITQPASSTSNPGGSGYDAVGNIQAYTDSVNGTWSFGYDNLNRLVSSNQTPVASTAAQAGCWSYDSFGNLQQAYTSSASFSSTTGPCQPDPNAVTAQTNLIYTDGSNRISSGTWRDRNGNFNQGSPAYDAVGNMTNDLSNQYLYDPDGHVCAAQTSGGMIGYLYNAEGRRVAKGTITSMGCDPTANGFQATSLYAIGPDGSEIAEVDGTGKWVHTNLSVGGETIATYKNDGKGVHFQLTDWLGTRRVQTDQLGNVEDTCTSQPFGDQMNCSNPGIDASQHHFTGKERDAESGLDNFEARYYGSNMGRFMSPDYDDDPTPVPFANLSNPQSLNLYSYGGNNPIRYADPDGHDVRVCDNNGQCNTVSNGAYTAAQQGNNGGLNVPTLDQVGSNGNGSGQFNSTSITDGSGNGVGSATYVSNGGADYYANANGFNLLSNTSQVVKAGTAIYAGVYAGAFVAAGGLAAGGDLIVTGIEGDTSAIEFGKTANQISHAARHLLDEGLNPQEVQAAIKADIVNTGGVNPGSNTRTIEVAGKVIEYNAHRLASGVINVGRIVVK